jgi:hypothetical protein
MPLRPVTEVQQFGSESSVKCKDDEDRDVIVQVTGEAVTDYGWETGFEVAVAMFDAGRFNDKKNPAIVRVTTDDVKAWMASRD